ncbi:unnamed protein product [Closterium sp. NIES-53]
MEIAHTSMCHASAPSFLWPFPVCYVTHQLNMWPCSSQPQVSSTLLCIGSPAQAYAFRVWGCLPHVRDRHANKLASHTVQYVIIGFPLVKADCLFWHPPSRSYFATRDVTFEESVPSYVRFSYRGSTLPPPPEFLTAAPPPGPAPQVASVPPRLALSGLSHVTSHSPLSLSSCSQSSQKTQPPGFTLHQPVSVDTRGTGEGGAAVVGTGSGGADTGGAGSEGADEGGLGSGGANAGGAGSRGASASGFAPEGTGIGGAPASAVAAAAAAAAAEPTAAPTAALVGPPQQPLHDVIGLPCSSTDHEPPSSLPLPLVDPDPAHFPHRSPRTPLLPDLFCLSSTWSTRHDPRARPSSPFPGFHPICHRFSPLRVSPPPIPSPHQSFLAVFPPSFSDFLHAARPTTSRVLSSLDTHPTAPPSSISTLVAAVTDFASSHHLDYATQLVTDATHLTPVGGEFPIIVTIGLNVPKTKDRVHSRIYAQRL